MPTLTPAQFALATGADAKWIQNARRILHRSAQSGAAEARWLGLVHELHASLAIALDEAARIADLVTDVPPDLRSLRVRASESGSVAITIDPARERSVHLARLARAIALPPPDRRGRPIAGWRRNSPVSLRGALAGVNVSEMLARAVGTPAGRADSLEALSGMLSGLVAARVRFVVAGDVAAVLHGSVRRPRALDVVYDSGDPATVRSLAALLVQWDARPRGVARQMPFVMDDRLLRAVPVLALETSHGALNLLDRLDDIDFDAALAHVDARPSFVLPYRVLDLPTLIGVMRRGGRAVDRDAMFELEVLDLPRRNQARLEKSRQKHLDSLRQQPQPHPR